jgi:hypothetical protein
MSPTFPCNNHGNTNHHTETPNSDENQNGTRSGERKKTHDEELAKLFKLFGAGLLGVHLDAAPDERVLAHEHDGVAPQPAADVLELLGADVVGDSDEHLGVLIEKLAELLVVRDLLLGLGPLDRHRYEPRGMLSLARRTDLRAGRGGPSLGARQGGRLAAAASL